MSRRWPKGSKAAASDGSRFACRGPPGTGKSAYVRYLADRLGLEVMQKRTSDLVGMWVGQTERNIAAFAEARDEQAFLVFDEADSLLADRRSAHRHWEVSQVNEMLTWMESHPLPFACTTNFGEALDSAALRRFVFKATLGHLKPQAAAEAFRLFFGMNAPPEVGALHYALHRMRRATVTNRAAKAQKGFRLAEHVQEDDRFSYPVGTEKLELKALFHANAAMHLTESRL